MSKSSFISETTDTLRVIYWKKSHQKIFSMLDRYTPVSIVTTGL